MKSKIRIEAEYVGGIKRMSVSNFSHRNGIINCNNTKKGRGREKERERENENEWQYNKIKCGIC